MTSQLCLRQARQMKVCSVLPQPLLIPKAGFHNLGFGKLKAQKNKLLNYWRQQQHHHHHHISNILPAHILQAARAEAEKVAVPRPGHSCAGLARTSEGGGTDPASFVVGSIIGIDARVMWQ